MNTNPLSPSEIEMAEQIAEAHAFDNLSSNDIAASQQVAEYVAAVDLLLNTYRTINQIPSSEEQALDDALGYSDYLLDSVLCQHDYLNTLLWNAGHKIIDGDFQHDIIVSFSNESGQVVKLTWFNR